MSKTIANAQLSLAYRLGESAIPNTTAETNRRISWFVSGLEYIANKPLWFLWATDSTLDTVADTGTYNFPTDFFMIKRLKIDGDEYQKVPFEDVYKRFETPSGPPYLLSAYQQRSFYTEAETFTVIPTPATTGTNNIEVKGYKRPTMPTTNSSSIVVPDAYENLLVSFAEFRYWSTAHRRGKASDAEAEFRDVLREMEAENIRRHFGEI